MTDDLVVRQFSAVQKTCYSCSILVVDCFFLFIDETKNLY